MNIDNRPSIEQRCQEELKRAYESGYRSGRLGKWEPAPMGAETEAEFRRGQMDGAAVRQKANGGK
jgi:hypothetical protein